MWIETVVATRSIARPVSRGHPVPKAPWAQGALQVLREFQACEALQVRKVLKVLPDLLGRKALPVRLVQLARKALLV